MATWTVRRGMPATMPAPNQAPAAAAASSRASVVKSTWTMVM